MKFLGIVGSLRAQSFNKGVMQAAQELAPKDVELTIADISKLPPFNQDQEHDFSPAAQEFKALVAAADAIVFATPEYNYSVPGVLKNAIDWASRPYGDNAWEGKPAAIMGAAGGSIATARAQYHLRQIMVFLNMHPLNKPEVMIGHAASKFDEQGRLTDEDTRQHIAAQLEALVAWTKQLQK